MRLTFSYAYLMFWYINQNNKILNTMYEQFEHTSSFRVLVSLLSDWICNIIKLFFLEHCSSLFNMPLSVTLSPLYYIMINWFKRRIYPSTFFFFPNRIYPSTTGSDLHGFGLTDHPSTLSCHFSVRCSIVFIHGLHTYMNQTQFGLLF